MNDNDNSILPILRQENVQMIVSSAPDAYNTNAQSSARCTDFGKKLLAEIQTAGMSDDLDRRCADYIDKAKRTLRAMNERRAPFTKLFDQIRSGFTGMENDVDPTKKDTVPYQVQQARNAYAARKREEAERTRREEMLRQQRAAALSRYTQDAEDDYRRQFDAKVAADIDTLAGLSRSLTLAAFDQVADRIRKFNVTLGNDWFRNCQSFAHKPCEVTGAEAEEIRKATLNRLSVQFKEQYAAEVGEYRDTIVDSLPSAKRELERIAKADAAEQERMKADLEARKLAETARLDQERKQREEEAAAAKKAQQAAAEVGGLFGQAAVAAAVPDSYQPKTSVRKRIVLDAPDGILAVMSSWWAKEGRFMEMDELCKTFKKQITFCEKLANDKDNPELISSPFLHYEEEVKAK